MCGIIGIIGKDQVAERLVDGLKRLEYRGYDSAGVATVHDGRIDRRRAEGKLNNLVKVTALPQRDGLEPRPHFLGGADGEVGLILE